MTTLKHAIVIERSRADVYALAQEVERFPEFLPGYVESRIVKRQEGALLLSRAAVMEGRMYRWHSWVRFESPRAMHFEQAEGPLKGMHVDWIFDALEENRTRVTIVHAFQIRRPPAIGWWMERFIFRPRLDRMAQSVVEALKRACEQKVPRLKEEWEVVA